MYTKEDIKKFKHRGVAPEEIDRQLNNFKTGFAPVPLAAPATLDNGIKRINPAEELRLTEAFEEACEDTKIVKMVPASGSATRMFKDLFSFLENYHESPEEFLDFVQNREVNSMSYFFNKLDEFPFFTRLNTIIWEDGLDLQHLLKKNKYREILAYILTEKGLNYGNTPKGLIDFHIYRDFVRTAFDEHIVEAALYCVYGKESHLHFTVSEEYLSLFKERLKKVAKVFEKKLDIKYNVTFSVQKPSTDMVSIDEKGELVRNPEGEVIFRPGGHGALIHNLDEINADVIFIKNIDNVIPDRSKGDTVKYKQLIGAVLLELQKKIFNYLHLLDKKDVTEATLTEIETFVVSETGYKPATENTFTDQKQRVKFLKQVLNRPIRVCGMVKNEGEPGGGPFWVRNEDGSSNLMIIESAQINLKDKEQKKIFEQSTHFNPVDIVCGVKDYKGRKFDLTKFVDYKQGFITRKSYKGKDIQVQELPGLWNGAMALWTTVFVEVPLTTFTPVKTVFDLLDFKHRNVIKK